MTKLQVIVKNHSTPRPVDQSSFSVIVKKPSFSRGSERSSFSRGSERSSFSRGSERSSFSRGSERSSFSRGSERSSFSRGSGKPSLPRALNTSSFSVIVKKASLPAPLVKPSSPVPLVASVLPAPVGVPSLIELKLPRAVEADPRKSQIDTILKREPKKLWDKSSITVPQISLSAKFESCLRAMVGRKQVERGLERIDQLLTSEQKGLLALQQKQASTPSHRVSRLLIIANDGSERFYRACEKTLFQHKERLILVYLNEPSSRLAQIFIGEKANTLKAILVSDRDAVSAALFSLAEDVSTEVAAPSL